MFVRLLNIQWWNNPARPEGKMKNAKVKMQK
jgi:hypothetical protein